jgi:hypothetical protein
MTFWMVAQLRHTAHVTRASNACTSDDTKPMGRPGAWTGSSRVASQTWQVAMTES